MFTTGKLGAFVAPRLCTVWAASLLPSCTAEHQTFFFFYHSPVAGRRTFFFLPFALLFMQTRITCLFRQLENMCLICLLFGLVLRCPRFAPVLRRRHAGRVRGGRDPPV